MEIRLTVEIDGTRYGMVYPNAERVSSEQFGEFVKLTIDRVRGYVYMAELPEEEV